MFTGLVRHLGRLSARDARGIAIDAPTLRPELALGDSVAVNGVCLTVAELTDLGFRADLLEATGRTTTLGRLGIGINVNLEPALAVGDRLGGHFVQGHIDGTIACRKAFKLPDGNLRLEFELPEWLSWFVLLKGSIAVNGVSLTVQELAVDYFAVQVIPTTARETNLGSLQPGGEVNIEADMIVRAVRMALSQAGLVPAKVDSELISRLGFSGKG